MPEHIPHTNCRSPGQSVESVAGLQYYNSNLCSQEGPGVGAGTLFTRTFLSTARKGVAAAGHSLSGKWKSRKLAAETEMKPNGTSKTNLQNENATHRGREGVRSGAGEAQHPPRYSFGDLPVTGFLSPSWLGPNS